MREELDRIAAAFGVVLGEPHVQEAPWILRKDGPQFSHSFALPLAWRAVNEPNYGVKGRARCTFYSIPRIGSRRFFAADGKAFVVYGFGNEGVTFVRGHSDGNFDLAECMIKRLITAGYDTAELEIYFWMPISHHEKLELRLLLPRELWPQEWKHIIVSNSGQN